MPTEIQNASITRSLVNLFRVKGRFRPRLDELIVPVALVANTLEDDEAREQKATAFVQAAAPGAGLSARAFFGNGFSSTTGAILIVDRVLISRQAGGAAVNVRIQQTTNVPVAPIAGSSTDVSWNDQGQPGTPPGLVAADDGGFTGPTLAQLALGADLSVEVELNQTLRQDQAVVVRCLTNNERIDVAFFYRVISA